VVDSDPMDLSALVTHLVTKATATVAAISPNGSSEPNTFKQALKHHLKNHWLKAAFSEIRQLLTTKTFYFGDRSEASKSPITSRWVFKEKKDSQGNVVKHKARLVVRGFQQVPGTDFTETFASTATPPTWRVVLAIAAVQDLEIQQIDFVGAFLNSGVDFDIYMEAFEGLYEYSLSGEEAVRLLKRHGWDPSKDQVILLKKSLYGLK